MLAILLTICFVVLIGLIVWYSWKYGITPTPTSPKVKQLLLDMVPVLTKGEIAEFGSGWGTLAFALADKFPACKIIGLEISPIPYFCSLLISKCYGYRNLILEREDFFHYPLESTTLVVCYLYPGAMERLKVKFEKELAPDAYVISQTFAVPGWKPLRMLHTADLYRTPIYFYQLKISTS